MRLALHPPALAWLLALTFVAPAPARAVTLDWAAAVDGFAGVAARWNPAQQPTAADALRFQIPGTYTVSFGANVPASASLSSRDGNARLSFLVPHVSPAFLTSAGIAPTVPMLEVVGGTLTVNGILAGGFAGTGGELRISGSSTHVDANLAGASAGNVIVSPNVNGTGTLVVENGGLLTTVGGVTVAPDPGTDGTLVLQGGDATRRSTLTVSTTTDFTPLGIGPRGVGAVEVIDGALLDVDRDVQLATQLGSDASLHVAGVGVLDSARVVVSGDLLIGDPFDFGGTASVDVGAGGVVEVGGATYTYNGNASGVTSLALAEGGRFATHDLHVGTPSAELLHTGGTLQITGGTLDLSGDPLRINSATGTPTVELLAGSTCAINSATTPALEVGGSADGRMNVLDGSSLTVHDRLVWVGTSAGGDGTLQVGSGGTLVTDQDLIVGRGGHGFFLVDGGGQATLAGLNTSTQAGGLGQVTITDPGSEVHVTGELVLSGILAGSSGASSSRIVAGGARLWLDAPGSPGTVWGPGTLTVTSASEVRLASLSSLEFLGTLVLGGGSVIGGNINLNGGGDITGTGDVSATLWDTLDTLSVVTATGPLSLGNAGDPIGYIMRGRLEVGAHTVTLRDADSASVGAVILSGGTLQGPPGGLLVELAAYLKGTGTVLGRVRNRGSIFAEGAAGLAFGGLLQSDGRPVQGSLIRFLTGGGFSGSGSILAPVQVDAGATVTPLAGLTLGNGAAQLMKIDGKVDVGAQSVTFNTTLPVAVTGEIALLGGIVSSPGLTPLQILSGGVLSGSGLSTMPVDLAGRLRPGPDAVQFSVQSLTVQPTGTIEVELGDHTLAENDRVAVALAATLDGTLDVRMLPSYNAVPGDSFLVLTSASRTGTFANVTLASAPAAGKLAVHYNGSQVWVVVEPGFADVPGALDRPSALAFAPHGSPGRAVAFDLALPEASTVSVEVFDVSGRRVARLAGGVLAAGRHRFAVPREGAGAGLLYARAEIVSMGTRRTLMAKAVRLR